LADFTLDTSTLGGSDFDYAENPELTDRGRSIQLQWDQGGANQDLELFGYSVRYTPAEETPKENV